MSEFALEEIAAERAAPETAAPDGRGGRRSVPSQLLHNPLAVFSLAWLVIIIVVAIGAPWLAPYEPTLPSWRRPTLHRSPPVTRWVATPRAATSCPGSCGVRARP